MTMTMTMNCVWFSSSIPSAPGISVGLGSSSSLCNPNPKRGRVATRSRRGLTCNALFGLGVPELVVIAGVAALVFGPKNLPEVGGSIGKTVKSFQQAAKEFESELKKEPDSIATEVDSSLDLVAATEQDKHDIEVSTSKNSL